VGQGPGAEHRFSPGAGQGRVLQSQWKEADAVYGSTVFTTRRL
jgi:hypothetical protein